MKRRAKIAATLGPATANEAVLVQLLKAGADAIRCNLSHIALAVDEGADYLGASYVARARDLEALREVVRGLGDEIPIVAKLERRAAVEHLEEIAASADALMVARSDLGVEVPLHEVPVLLMGHPIEQKPLTNLLRIHRVDGRGPGRAAKRRRG